MKVAYLILAHNEPKMLDKLLTALKKPKEQIFVHIDKKTDIKQFENAVTEKCRLLQNRVNVSWGSFSIIQAELNLLNAAFATDKFDYYCLLSGCDFPIKPVSEFENYLSKNAGKEFIECIKESDLPASFPKRYKGFYLFENRTKWLLKVNYGITKIQRYFYSRKPCLNQSVFWGSQWWALSGNFIEYCINFLKNTADYSRYFRHTLIPDTMFFSTMIAHSPFSVQNTKDNLRLIYFEKDSPHPRIWTVEHKDEILNSEAFFARKFDLKKDAEIIDFLNDYIKRKKDFPNYTTY